LFQGDRLINSRGTSVIITDWERVQKDGYDSPDCPPRSQKIERAWVQSHLPFGQPHAFCATCLRQHNTFESVAYHRRSQYLRWHALIALTSVKLTLIDVSVLSLLLRQVL
jgi:hypothetical protein